MFTVEEVQSIRECSYRIEKENALPRHLLQLMYEKKLFKLFVPQELGGLQLPLPETVSVFRESARIDGNFGWLVTIGAGGGMFVPAYKKERAVQLFGAPDAVIAGSGYPSGRAVKTTGGYQVSGEWKFCSGAPYATMFTANAKVEDDGQIISFIFMPEQVEVLDDWHAFGLKGTGSHSIKVDNVFVPADCTFQLSVQENEYAGSVHSFPFIPFAEASFTAVCLGLGDRFFEEAKIILEKNRVYWSKGEKRRDRIVERLIDGQEARFKEVDSQFTDLLAQSWKKHEAGEELSVEEMETFTKTAKETVGTLIDCTNQLIRHLGMEAVMETSALNRTWRDLYTAAQHAFLIP